MKIWIFWRNSLFTSNCQSDIFWISSFALLTSINGRFGGVQTSINGKFLAEERVVESVERAVEMGVGKVLAEVGLGLAAESLAE